MILRDLSNNNGTAGLRIIQESATDAYYFKATEGLGFKDGFYPEYRAAAAKRGKPSGAYLFLRHDEDGAAQARYFLAYAKPKPGDLQPVVDVETGSPGLIAHVARAALLELRRAGFDPILYTSSSWLSPLYHYSPGLKLFRVWDAEYGPVLHRVPGANYIAWQFTDRLIVGKGPLRSDGSRIFVRSLSALEIPRPTPAPGPSPVPAPVPVPKPKPKPKPKRRRDRWYVVHGGIVMAVGSKIWKRWKRLHPKHKGM